jgi:hypothetical protein
MGSWFKLHVIPPPNPLGWQSPRSLLTDTLWHHILQDEAPIGHFYIEFKSEVPWKNGVGHVLTGMSRKNANLSTLRVMREQVGLGTFFHDFPGKLDSGRAAQKELLKVQKKNRLKSIKVDVTPERAHLLFDELNEWIRHGSHLHYGGGHQILKGEGAGCAEMGAHFLNLALGIKATPREWIRSVYAPLELVGGPKTGRRIGLTRIFLEGKSWAKSENEGVLYATPDMELTWEWLSRYAPGKNEVSLSPAEITWAGDPAQRVQFQELYPNLSSESLAEVWGQIRLDQ